jgi:hypothetical protein
MSKKDYSQILGLKSHMRSSKIAPPQDSHTPDAHPSKKIV